MPDPACTHVESEAGERNMPSKQERKSNPAYIPHARLQSQILLGL